MKKIILLTIIFLLLYSCKNYDCEGIDCSTLPLTFRLEIVDEFTRENLFSNGTFEESQITITNTKNNNSVEFDFIKESGLNIIKIETIGLKTEVVNYTINIANQVVFNFIVNAERVSENCCSFTKIKGFKIENIKYERNKDIEFIQILVENKSINTSKLIYTLKEDYGNHNIIYRKEYIIDDDNNRVLSEKYTTSYTQELTYLSLFKYNSLGKLIKEIRNGEVHKVIKWEGNIASVYNKENVKIAKFLFNNGKLINIVTSPINSIEQEWNYSYDNNGNVILIGSSSEVIWEYFEYDLSKLSPFYLIKSIEIVRYYQRPYFKNIFKIEKGYDPGGDDYGPSTKFFNYYYIFDEYGRVTTIRDDHSVIYVSEFQYH